MDFNDFNLNESMDIVAIFYNKEKDTICCIERDYFLSGKNFVDGYLVWECKRDCWGYNHGRYTRIENAIAECLKHSELRKDG